MADNPSHSPECLVVSRDDFSSLEGKKVKEPLKSWIYVATLSSDTKLGDNLPDFDSPFLKSGGQEGDLNVVSPVKKEASIEEAVDLGSEEVSLSYSETICSMQNLRIELMYKNMVQVTGQAKGY